MRRLASRKFLGFLVTVLGLVVGAKLAPSASYSALATALVATYAALTGSNVVDSHLEGMKRGSAS